MKSLNSNSQKRELHQLQLEERQMQSNDMSCFKGLESHLRILYQNSFVHVERPKLVEMAFWRFFGEEHQNFRKKMLQNLDQLQLQFERKPLHAVSTKSCLKKLQHNSKNFLTQKRPSVPSSSPRGGNEIYGSREKLCVTLFLATLCQGWTIRIAKTLSFPDASPFFAAFGWSFRCLVLVP
nr:hypothetical protein [Tanacetum cinerariifolium]